MGMTSAIIQGANTVGQFASQQYGAKSIDQQSNFDASIAAINARDATFRGNYDANRRVQQGKGIIGAQRAAAGASGIDPNTGTPADLQAGEAGYSAMDALTIKNNAARQAWGYSAQSQLNQLAAKNQSQQLRTSSYNTLLTGAGKTYSMIPRNSDPYAATKQVASDPRLNGFWAGSNL